jgi:psiF repeat
MKQRMVWLVGCAVVWAVSVTAALAESGKRVASAERAELCAHEAKGLKGEEHQRVVTECVKEAEGGGQEASHPQQQRMKNCNAEAGRKELHGDERRAFMSACLRG